MPRDEASFLLGPPVGQEPKPEPEEPKKKGGGFWAGSCSSLIPASTAAVMTERIEGRPDGLPSFFQNENRKLRINLSLVHDFGFQNT